LAFEGSENWGAMPATSTDGSSRDDQGQIAAAISTAVVHVFSEHTGRGPTRARTTIDGTTVVVILQDSMVAVVEQLTTSRVNAFMSANHIAPDAAAAAVRAAARRLFPEGASR